MYSINKGDVSVFGGQWANESCIQQIVADIDLGTASKCLSISESTLGGLESSEIRYSNFVSKRP